MLVFKGIDGTLTFTVTLTVVLLIFGFLILLKFIQKVIMVSERKVKSNARARRNVARGLMANINARRAEQNQAPPQPPHDAERVANQVIQPPNAIPERELNPLPHGQMVRARIVRSDGIDSTWDPKLIRFYECWWNVSFNQNSSNLLNFEFR